MAKLAFLGTGLIGAGLAEAAAKRGDQVSAYNRTAAKARALESVGVKAFESAAAAVEGAERVHIALSDDAAVDAVLAQCEAGLGAAVVVDHTTASPAGTKARAARLEARGVAFVHAPVFMSPAMCRAAQGMMLVAAPKPVFERVADGLKAMTGNVDYVGERRDLAAAYKLFGNAMILTLTAGLSDVYSMAAELGIPATDAHALFSKFNPAGVLTYRGKSMSEGNYQASFELTMARKDARLMIEAGGRGQHALQLLPTIAARMDQLIERGYGADDVGVLAVDAVPKRE